jgi:hypothetical protein
MLADGKIDSLDTHLEQFKLNDQNRQIDLTVSRYRHVTNSRPLTYLESLKRIRSAA